MKFLLDSQICGSTPHNIYLDHRVKTQCIYNSFLEPKNHKNEEIRKYQRMSFLTGDMNNTIFINANYPVLVKDLVYDAIKNSLLTAKFGN